VGNAIVGFGDVEKLGKDAACGRVCIVAASRVVVLLGASEEGNEVVLAVGPALWALSSTVVVFLGTPEQ